MSFSTYAKASPKATEKAQEICKKATTCYTEMVTNASGKRTHTLKNEKVKCDRIKKECERILIEEKELPLNLDQAYDAYQQAFERYTSMVTNAKIEDEATVQEAREAYRNSYARYKKLKESRKQSSLKPPEESTTLDASGIDGIVAIDPADVENNIEYIEGLRKRSNTQIDKKTKLSLGANCKSKKIKRLLDNAEAQTEKDHFKEALKLYRQAHSICPMKNIEEQMAWLLSQIKTPENGHEQLVSSAKDQIKVIDLPAKAKTIVPKPYDVISKVITKKGGVISDSMMRLHIPPHALLKNKKIVIKRIHGLLPKGRSNSQVSLPEAKQIGTAYDFGPDGIRFKKAVTITIKYKEKDIPAGIIESNLFLVYYDGEKWIKIDTVHDKKNNTFYANVEGFPGSIIVTVGVPILIAAGAYALKTGVHKKIYQLIWDPIKKNWVHKFIKPQNKLVKKYAKRIGVTTPIGKNAKIVSFDDPKKLATYLHRKITRKNPELIIGFKGNNNKFTDLTDKYISEAETVEPVEHYLNNIERKGKKFGDCIDVANTLVSILRSKGYKIKGVSGYLNGNPHAWSEIVIGNEIYGIDEKGRISKLDYLKKSVTYPKLGDPYRKEWDEKGTRVYKPTMLITTPAFPIYAGDGKKHVFTLKTFGLPKKTLFSWNFNNLGNSLKSRKKTFAYKFEATGKYTLKATAFWDGNELSKKIAFNVKGKNAIEGSCKDVHFHIRKAEEEVDFILLTPTELYKESEKNIGKKLTPERKKNILFQQKGNIEGSAKYFKKILPINCYKEVLKLNLLVAFDGKRINHRTGKIIMYKRGYQIQTLKPLEKPKTTKPSGAGNPFGGYTP